MTHNDAAALRLRLRSLAHNMFWTWHPPTRRLFGRIEPAAWRATNQSPLGTLEVADDARLTALGADAAYLEEVGACEQALHAHIHTQSWYDREQLPAMRVAYFSMEYGLHESLPIYSGGLGVLAGDHLKSASDLGVPLCAVGLLYRRGFYTQRLDREGKTIVEHPLNNPEEQPIADTGARVNVHLADRQVEVRVWRAEVGRVPLYLLDADLEGNEAHDRELTERLYAGDSDMRIRQELLLGIGGLRALEAVGEQPTIYHLNEGHAGFCTLERLAGLIEGGAAIEQARETVRASTVFTTHTPVPAGHDRFEPAMVWHYLAPLAGRLGLDLDGLIDLGREHMDDGSHKFCMTVLALHFAQHCNGVSKLHGAVSREMWQKVFGVQNPDEVPIGHITNGIHSRSWLAPEALGLYERYLEPQWEGSGPEHDPWQHVDRIPDAELWALRHTLRARLVNFIRHRTRAQRLRRGEDTDALAKVHTLFDPDVLTIGFARRFATYKRAPLVFFDMPRIEAILNHAERPVQLVFAGKAHPADDPGRELVRTVYAMARHSGLEARVVMLENYDMNIGRVLTSGCDVWLNNPIRPHEASGTSGMKPPLHGGLNCSVLDGWWPECYNGANGWEIGGGNEFELQEEQDRHDAECIYALLEQEIAPLFYHRDESGIPHGWVQWMRESMRTVCAAFSTQRMVGDYVRKLYIPANPIS